jgi:hypothetical protein
MYKNFIPGDSVSDCSKSHYDERRRPRRGAPAADQSQGWVKFKPTQKIPCPPCPGEALRRVTPVNTMIYT